MTPDYGPGPLFSFFETVNPFLWATGNITLVLASFALAFYWFFYRFFMNSKKYAAGRTILSISGWMLLVIVLIVVGLLDSDTVLNYPEQSSVFWRPVVRAVTYFGLFVAMLRLDLLVVSRWRGARPVKIEVTGETIDPLTRPRWRGRH